MKFFLIQFVFLFSLLEAFTSFSASAQTYKVITGNISDEKTNVPLVYASVSLKNHVIGTVSNEYGEFRFLYPANIIDDTLMIDYIGYELFSVPTSSIQQHLNVNLIQKAVEIDEVLIYPLSPEDYIRKAIKKIHENYELSAYQTSSYYKGFISQDDNIIFGDEAIFKTYHPDFYKYKQNQHQLMLYRKPYLIEEFKWDEKRKNKKNKDSGNYAVSEGGRMNSGGPEDLLAFDLLKQLPSFLDTNLLKKYNFSFGREVFYHEKELICIEFSSRNRVDSKIEDDVDIIKEKQSREILIDKVSMAIVAIEMEAKYIIPLYVKPLLSLYRINIKHPSFKQQICYIQNDDKWYLKSMRIEYQGELIRQYLLDKNERSLVKFEQVYCVNEFNFHDPLEIPEVKRFIPNNQIEKQIYNDDSLLWDNMNVIK